MNNYDEAFALFAWLGFQPSDDNDCHRFPSSPVARMAALLDETEARGRQAGRREYAGGDYSKVVRQIVYELTGEANKAKMARVELILSGKFVREGP